MICLAGRMSAEAALTNGKREVLDWLRSRNAIEVDFRDWPVQFWGLRTADELHALEKALLR